MSVAALVSALFLAVPTPDPVRAEVQQDREIQLPDIEITGRPTRERVEEFVGRIAAPPRGRGLGRWEDKLCPGVVNLSREVAQPILDRIADTARNLDLEVREPGCDPNLVIIFTVDAAAIADTMVARDRSLFTVGVGGISRDRRALLEFRTSDAPVRWWTLSFPVNTETGTRAVRIPGDAPGMPLAGDQAAAFGCSADCALSYAPVINLTSATRLRTQIADAIYKTIIIVDADQMNTVSLSQLSDYLAFVSLAQVDGAAETQEYDTVLNLFSGGGRDGMTDWDRSYLRALYGSFVGRRTASGHASDVANLMTRERLIEARRRD